MQAVKHPGAFWAQGPQRERSQRGQTKRKLSEHKHAGSMAAGIQAVEKVACATFSRFS